jgi:hypothetical protein
MNKREITAAILTLTIIILFGLFMFLFSLYPVQLTLIIKGLLICIGIFAIYYTMLTKF